MKILKAWYFCLFFHIRFHIYCDIKVNCKAVDRVGVCLLVIVSASRALGHGFPHQPGHTKDHHKNGTNFLPAWHASVWVAV